MGLRVCVYYGNYVIMCAEICAYMCYSHKHTISWITHKNVHVILLHMYCVKDLKESAQMELIIQFQPSTFSLMINYVNKLICDFIYFSCILLIIIHSCLRSVSCKTWMYRKA